MASASPAAAYIQEKAEQLQKCIVNYKSAMTNTVDGSILISRSTSCDVISVVTTVAPVKHGEMKDIRMTVKEIKRLRAPVGRAPGKITRGNPLEDGQIVDHEKNHMLNCSLLRKERKEFMEKLRTSRYIRTVVENGAAVTVQKYYRCYSTRRDWDRIVESRNMCQQLCTFLCRHFAANGQKDMLVTPMQHRINYKRKRFASARRIQCIFRKFISRRVLQYRRHMAFMVMRRKMAVRIQCLARRRAAHSLVKLLRTRRKLSKYRRSALFIQTHVRMMFARRVVRKTIWKFRNIAARMIQCWYRAKHSKWKTGKLMVILLKEKQFIAALGLQGIVRRKVARHRVYRLRLRRLYLYVFVNVLRIQCMLRKRLSRKRVRKIRAERLEAAKAKGEADKAAEKGLQSKSQEAAAAAAAGAAANDDDLRALVKAGSQERVVAVIRSMRGPTSEPTYADEQGDTLLTLSALYGYASLVEKLLELGFDVNHRNTEGFNALMLSVKHRHHDVTNYLLSPAVKLKLNPTVLLQEDAPFLLVATLDGIAKSAGREDQTQGVDLLKSLIGPHGLASSIGAKDARYKNMAPIHMAAFSGNMDAFSLVLRSRPQTDVVDSLSRTPLHLACMSPNSSTEIVRTLLGLETASGVIVNETKRSVSLLKPDAEGKDCLLLAALAGQSAVLQFVRDFIQSDKFKVAAPAEAVPIVWTLADIDSALRLAEMGDDVCLSYILDAGFDARCAGTIRPNASALGLQVTLPNRTGTTLPMAACLYGNILFVNVLLEREVNFASQTDSLGQTAMHYAAACPNGGSLVAHLLVHEKAKACGISEMALAVQDHSGWTPLHTAAWSGVELTVDLLARRGMEKAMALRDRGAEGLTPLLMAAKFQQKSVMQLYLRVADDATVVDNMGRSALWWFFHPELPAAVPAGADNTAASTRPPSRPPSRPPLRPPSSEYLSRKGLLGKINKREKDEAMRTLETDVELIRLLLSHECPLYAGQTPVSPQELLAIKNEPVDPAVLDRRTSLEAGDLLVQELALTALQAIPAVLSKNDAWRLGELHVYMFCCLMGPF